MSEDIEVRRLTPYRNWRDFKDVWGYRIANLARWRCRIWGCAYGEPVSTLGPLVLLGATHVVCRRCGRSCFSGKQTP